MTWLAKDFADERRWKLNASRRVARAVDKWHRDVGRREERAAQMELAVRRRAASRAARHVTSFWAQVQRLVKWRADETLAQLKADSRDRQLTFLVGQTERYSDMLTHTLGRPPSPGATTSAAPAASALRLEDALASAAGPQRRTEEGVRAVVPHLLRASLRDYQLVALDWLVGMYDKVRNAYGPRGLAQGPGRGVGETGSGGGGGGGVASAR